MRDVAERVSILRDRGVGGDLEPEGDALLIGRVNWSQAYVVMGMGGRMLVNISSDVFDAEQHSSQRAHLVLELKRQACEKIIGMITAKKDGIKFGAWSGREALRKRQCRNCRT